MKQDTTQKYQVIILEQALDCLHLRLMTSSLQPLKVDAWVSLANAVVFSLESTLKAIKCNRKCTAN